MRLSSLTRAWDLVVVVPFGLFSSYGLAQEAEEDGSAVFRALGEILPLAAWSALWIAVALAGFVAALGGSIVAHRIAVSIGTAGSIAALVAVLWARIVDEIPLTAFGVGLFYLPTAVFIFSAATTRIEQQARLWLRQQLSQ